MSQVPGVEKVISYRVTLPSGVVFNINYDIGFTPEDFAWLEDRFNDSTHVSTADLAQALCEDCENGVKWLNEQAVDSFKKNYPRLWDAIHK